jgi:hypothetical protein
VANALKTMETKVKKIGIACDVEDGYRIYSKPGNEIINDTVEEIRVDDNDDTPVFTATPLNEKDKGKIESALRKHNVPVASPKEFESKSVATIDNAKELTKQKLAAWAADVFCGEESEKTSLIQVETGYAGSVVKFPGGASVKISSEQADEYKRVADLVNTSGIAPNVSSTERNDFIATMQQESNTTTAIAKKITERFPNNTPLLQEMRQDVTSGIAKQLKDKQNEFETMSAEELKSGKAVRTASSALMKEKLLSLQDCNKIINSEASNTNTDWIEVKIDKNNIAEGSREPNTVNIVLKDLPVEDIYLGHDTDNSLSGELICSADAKEAVGKALNKTSLKPLNQNENGYIQDAPSFGTGKKLSDSNAVRFHFSIPDDMSYDGAIGEFTKAGIVPEIVKDKTNDARGRIHQEELKLSPEQLALKKAVLSR